MTLAVGFNCLACEDTGHVCENHPHRPWNGYGYSLNGCDCGAGMPCLLCCAPIPQDGSHSIADAFVPRKAMH